MVSPSDDVLRHFNTPGNLSPQVLKKATWQVHHTPTARLTLLALLGGLQCHSRGPCDQCGVGRGERVPLFRAI